MGGPKQVRIETEGKLARNEVHYGARRSFPGITQLFILEQKVGHALRDAGLLRKKQERKVLARLGKEQVLSTGHSNYKVDTIVNEQLIPVSKDDEGYGHHVSDYGESSDNRSRHHKVSWMSTEDEGNEGDDSSLDSSTATTIFHDAHHGRELLESSLDSFLPILDYFELQDHKTPTLGNDKPGNGYRTNHADVDVSLSSVFLDFLHDKGDANVIAIGAWKGMMFHMLSALVSEQFETVFDSVEITVLCHYNRSAINYFHTR